MQAVVGACFAALVALVAWRAGALSRSGAFAATVVGAVAFGVGGWPAALVLFAFFIPSTLLSRIGRARKRALVDIGKTGARDAWQVLANGGVATVAMLLSLRGGAPVLAAFAGAFAAASADTWGTEIGTLLRMRPRSILTLEPLATGISGGVTAIGTLAEVLGAATVALVAMLVHLAPFWPVAIAGFLGAVLDSVLGASAQALRHCPSCDRDCETNPHACGSTTVIRRGFGWFENDAVNAAATIAGAVLAYYLCLYVFSR